MEKTKSFLKIVISVNFQLLIKTLKKHQMIHFLLNLLLKINFQVIGFIVLKTLNIILKI